MIYNLMYDWIMSGRVGPVPVSISDANEYGLGPMVTELSLLGQSSLEMLAGPMQEIVLGGANSTINITDTAILTELEEMALAQKEKATVRSASAGPARHHSNIFCISNT